MRLPCLSGSLKYWLKKPAKSQKDAQEYSIPKVKSYYSLLGRPVQKTRSLFCVRHEGRRFQFSVEWNQNTTVSMKVAMRKQIHKTYGGPTEWPGLSSLAEGLESASLVSQALSKERWNSFWMWETYSAASFRYRCVLAKCSTMVFFDDSVILWSISH